MVKGLRRLGGGGGFGRPLRVAVRGQHRCRDSAERRSRPESGRAAGNLHSPTRPLAHLPTREPLIERIIDEAYQLLLKPGIKVQNEEARKLLLDAGAQVDEETMVVRIPARVSMKRVSGAGNIAATMGVGPTRCMKPVRYQAT